MPRKDRKVHLISKYQNTVGSLPTVFSACGAIEPQDITADPTRVTCLHCRRGKQWLAAVRELSRKDKP